jgi:hypothetical protein
MTMPTSTKSGPSTRNGLTDYYLYAPLGAGQLIVEKTREATRKALTVAKRRRKAAMKAYLDLARRGERLATSVRRSAHTRRAMDQAKAARSQVKAAATSLRKTADATTKATKAAAKKVG